MGPFGLTSSKYETNEVAETFRCHPHNHAQALLYALFNGRFPAFSQRFLCSFEQAFLYEGGSQNIQRGFQDGD